MSFTDDNPSQRGSISTWKWIFYWTVWLGGSMLPLWWAHVSSMHHAQAVPFLVLEDGWSWLSFKQDVADAEWEFFKTVAVPYTVACLCSSLACWFVRQRDQTTRSLLSLLVAGAVAVYFVSLKGFFLILTHVCSLYLLCLPRSLLLAWCGVVAAIFSVHSRQLFQWQLSAFHVDDPYRNVIMFSLLMCILRYVSYSSSICRLSVPSGSRNQASTPSFLLYCYYILYTPLFLNGPVVQYNVFCAGVGCPPSMSKSRAFSVLRDMFTCCVYFFLLELAHHFIYSTSISRTGEYIQGLAPWEVAGFMWYELHNFSVKYIICYRFSGLFTKLDGIESPGDPCCVSNLISFSKMWRYFDKGLYNLLKDDIYIPLGGSQKGHLRQISASLVCFAFIAYWHGANEMSCCWAIVNWAGLSLEVVLMRKAKTAKLANLKTHNIVAACSSLCCMSVICANIIFLCGVDATRTYVMILLWAGFPLYPVGAFIFFYCGYYCTTVKFNMREADAKTGIENKH